MAFKFIAFATLLAAANAGVLPSAPLAYAAAPAAHFTYAAAPAIAHAAPVAYAAAPVAKAVVTKAIDEEYDPNPQYSYAYDVQDGITGDNKQQQETRNGDAVQGSYSFIEADGTRRIVEYTADPLNGFNAVVHKEPAGVAVKTVAAAAPVAYAAPAHLIAKSYAAAPALPIATKAYY